MRIAGVVTDVAVKFGGEVETYEGEDNGSHSQ
jgi:tRNA splicing endonuclease